VFLDVVRGLCEVVLQMSILVDVNFFCLGDYNSPFVVKFMRVFTMF
jgi:hypothetical protein